MYSLFSDECENPVYDEWFEDMGSGHYDDLPDDDIGSDYDDLPDDDIGSDDSSFCFMPIDAPDDSDLMF